MKVEELRVILKTIRVQGCFQALSFEKEKNVKIFLEHDEALLDLWEAARGIRDRERIGGYGFEGIPELLEALERLEAVK